MHIPNAKEPHSPTARRTQSTLPRKSGARLKHVFGRPRLCFVVLAVAVCVGVIWPCGASAQQGQLNLPGWSKSAVRPGNFRVSRDTNNPQEGKASVLIESLVGRPGSATLTQSVRAGELAGKRVRMSAYVRTGTTGTGGGRNFAASRGGRRFAARLWMRVDTQAPDNRPFDNMYERPIKQAKQWEQHNIVLDVPNDAVGISFGALFMGHGKMWVDNFKFEIVDQNEATTGHNAAERKPATPARLEAMDKLYRSRPTIPRNLGFEEARRTLGIGIPANSLKVQHLVDGGHAAKAGIQKDDLVVSIGGRAIATRAELIETLNKGADQKTITVLRGKTRLVFDVDFSEPAQVAKAENVAEETVKSSGVTVTELNNQQTQHLVLLGKVWGFLKYHHPEVTSGNREWDRDLFRILPSIVDATDDHEARATILSWIDELGDISTTNLEPEPTQELALSPRLDWLLDESLLGEQLSERLQQIHAARPADGQQFYVDHHPSVGNPIFNEQVHVNVPLPDAGFRVLALFRYWNIIEYWSPYRDLIDRDWDDVLASYLPDMVAATDAADFERACLRLIVEVGDSHAGLPAARGVQPPLGEAKLPVTIRFLQGKAVVIAVTETQGGSNGGLQIGDVVTAIDGQPIERLTAKWRPFYWASNDTGRLARMARNLTRGREGPCSLNIVRNGKAAIVEMDRVTDHRLRPVPHDLPGEAFQLLGDDIAYVKLSSVKLSDARSYIMKSRGTKGMIVDIRNYPKAFMVFALGSHFVPEETEFARFTNADGKNPGGFLWTAPLSLTPNRPFYGGKVVVLVDEASVSQSEYTAMAFRAAPNSVIVGSTTAGADGNISRIVLPGGLSTFISGIGVFYPDRTPTQRVGIVPDIEAHPTPEGIRQGRDEVLEAGIRQILGDEVTDQEIRSLYRN